jgi:hypothetical protein
MILMKTTGLSKSLNIEGEGTTTEIADAAQRLLKQSVPLAYFALYEVATHSRAD